MKHNKWALLNIVREAVDSGEITTNDLAGIIRAKSGNGNRTNFSAQFLYYLGGLIALIGVILLLANHWANFSSTVRVLIAAGSPMIAYWAAVILAKDPQHESVAKPFFLIFAVLAPFAFNIGFYEAGALMQSFNQSYIMAFSWIACAWAFYFNRRADLLIFVVLYASFYYLSLLKYCHFLEASPHATEYHSIALLLLGIFYTHYLYRYWQQNRPGFSRAMSRIGMILVLFSLLTLRSKGMAWHWFWEVGMIIGLIANFKCAYWRQDTFLKVLGFIAVIVYVTSFTSDYFAQSLGWTFSLILAGLIIIALTFVMYRRRGNFS